MSYELLMGVPVWGFLSELATFRDVTNATDQREGITVHVYGYGYPLDQEEEEDATRHRSLI